MNTDQLDRLETAMDAMKRAMLNARDHLGAGLQVTRTQLEIMRLLAYLAGQTVGELARRPYLTQSAVTQTVDTLVRRELVERRADEADRRIIRLHLTAAGEAVMADVKHLHRQHLQAMMAALTAGEVESLISITQKLARSFSTGPDTKLTNRS